MVARLEGTHGLLVGQRTREQLSKTLPTMLLLRRSPRMAAACAARSTCAAAGFSTYAFNTPEIFNTSRKELEKQWDNLGFSIRNMNGHVK